MYHINEFLWEVMGGDSAAILALIIATAAISHFRNYKHGRVQNDVPPPPEITPRRIRKRIGVTYRASRHVMEFEEHPEPSNAFGIYEAGSDLISWGRVSQTMDRSGPNYLLAMKLFYVSGSIIKDGANHEPNDRTIPSSTSWSTKPTENNNSDEDNRAPRLSPGTVSPAEGSVVGLSTLERPESRLAIRNEEDDIAHWQANINAYLTSDYYQPAESEQEDEGIWIEENQLAEEISGPGNAIKNPLMYMLLPRHFIVN